MSTKSLLATGFQLHGGFPIGRFIALLLRRPIGNWGQRDYKVTGQLGLEETVDEHIDKLVIGFREIRRILRDDGILWVNYGDKYASIGRSPRKESPGVGAKQEMKGIARDIIWQAGGGSNFTWRLPNGQQQGDLLGLAWRLAFALQADGWILRDAVIWAKAISSFGQHLCPNCGYTLYDTLNLGQDLLGDDVEEVVNRKKSGSTMPESMVDQHWEPCRVKVKNLSPGARSAKWAANNQHGGAQSHREVQWAPCPGCDKCQDNGGLVLKKGSWRCTSAHEYVLMLTKKMGYYADGEAVKENALYAGDNRGERFDIRRNTDMNSVSGKTNNNRNLRNVWTINPQPNDDQICLGCGMNFTGRLKKRIKTIKVIVDGEEKTKQKCPNCGAVDQWMGHYATFPDELIEPLIKVSTSQKGCCPKCGAPWARIIQRQQLKRQRPNDRTDRHNQGNGVNSCGNTVAGIETQTLGWKATCHCNAGDPVPCVVYDPFTGTGVVPAAAAKLGRNYMGSELKAEYVKYQAIPKIHQAETGIRKEESQAGQKGLFR